MPRRENLLPNEEASEAVAVVASEVVDVVASEVVAVILAEVTAEDSDLADLEQTLQMIAPRKK